jgi:hypothetical protein
MLARTVVLEGESRERFNELCTTIADELQPVTATEHLLVQKMAVAHWREMRFWNLEKAGMDHEVARQSGDDASADPTIRGALALRTLGQTTSQFEIRCDRQFDRALSRFERLRERPIRGTQISANEPGK